MLLTQVPGATSFEFLRTVDTVVHDTFRAACHARGLLDDDREAGDAMTEAELDCLPPQLRSLFATFLAFHACTDPAALWEAHKAGMMEDLVIRCAWVCACALTHVDRPVNFHP